MIRTDRFYIPMEIIHTSQFEQAFATTNYGTKYLLPKNGSLRRFSCNVETNSIDAASSVIIAVNGSDVATGTIPQSSTGKIEFNANLDEAITQDDFLQIRIVTVGTLGVLTATAGIVFESNE